MIAIANESGSCVSGCKRYYGANFVSRFWHSYTEYTNLSPSDVDSLLIESALCKTASEVTWEDIERVLESSRQSFYEGHAKAMEAKIVSPQDCQEMTLRFNFFLRRKRIRVIWLNQWSSSASVNLGRLNEVQWEVVEHLLSIEVAVGQVWCYYLRVNDDLTWRLGPPIRIDLPSAHSTVSLVAYLEHLTESTNRYTSTRATFSKQIITFCATN